MTAQKNQLMLHDGVEGRIAGPDTEMIAGIVADLGPSRERCPGSRVRWRAVPVPRLIPPRPWPTYC